MSSWDLTGLRCSLSKTRQPCCCGSWRTTETPGPTCQGRTWGMDSPGEGEEWNTAGKAKGSLSPRTDALRGLATPDSGQHSLGSRDLLGPWLSEKPWFLSIKSPWLLELMWVGPWSSKGFILPHFRAICIRTPSYTVADWHKDHRHRIDFRSRLTQIINWVFPKEKKMIFLINGTRTIGCSFTQKQTNKTCTHTHTHTHTLHLASKWTKMDHRLKCKKRA
jgi:hypothetical protein